MQLTRLGLFSIPFKEKLGGLLIESCAVDVIFEGESFRDREREREREYVCVCACVRVRERASERERRHFYLRYIDI